VDEDLHLPGAPDLRRRRRGRLERERGVRHARPDGRGEGVARRQRQSHDRHRRPDRRHARDPARAARDPRGAGRAADHMTRRAWRALVVTALAAAAIMAAAPSGAWAHASLLATSPAAQRVAPHAPDAVALTFSEAIE